MANLPAQLENFVSGLRSKPESFALATAVLAYATGDAFGVAYEFEPKVTEVPKVMLGKADWPAGGVSDDTLLSLMTIACLEASNPEAAREIFVSKLREAAPSLRGLGPTTRHALGIFVEEREVGIIGTTNGGMMRTALLSLGFSNQEQRQLWVDQLCKATHFKTESRYAALVIAEIFATALTSSYFDADEALVDAIEKTIAPPEVRTALMATFVPAEGGISLNPLESLLAVLWIVRQAGTVWDAYELAIKCGGDTDTIAALSSALIALRNPESFYELEFIADVNWAEIPELQTRIEQLIESRMKS
jgi:ADP-ribosylglycohydrolase